MKTWRYRCFLMGFLLSVVGCAAPTTPTGLVQDADAHRAQLEMLQADLDVIQKRKELAHLPTTATPEARAVAAQHLSMAQRKANIAYQAAGIPAPYPNAPPQVMPAY